MSEEPPGKKRKDNSPLTSTCGSGNDQSDGRSVVKLMKTLRGLIDLSPPDFSYILNKLPFEDKLRLRLTCKYLYRLVMEDKGFDMEGVIKMDFKKGYDYEVFRILSLQIKVKIPSQNEIAKKENLIDEVTHFFDLFEDRIVDVDISNPCTNLFNLIFPKLRNLRKIKIQDRYDSLSSVEIANLIENNSFTLENLSLIAIRREKFTLKHSYPKMKVFCLQECNNKVVQQFVTKLTQLTRLSVNNNDDITDQNFSALIDDNSSTLVHLELKYVFANSKRILLRFPLTKLKELTLIRCGSNIVNQVEPQVSELQKLCIIDENYYTSTEKLNTLIKGNAPTLHYLELSADNKLEGNEKTQFPKLKVLKLIGSKSCSDAAFQYVIENSAKTLTTLSCRDIRNEIQVRKDMCNLKVLELRQCNEKFAKSIMRYAEPSLRNLEQIRLCNYKGDDLRYAVRDLDSLPFIKVLRLNNTERRLVNSLLEKCCDNLKELSLTDIDDYSFELDTELSSLTKLYLFQCSPLVTRHVLQKSATSLTEMKLYSSNLNINVNTPFPNLKEVIVNNRGRVDVRNSEFISQGGNLKQLEDLSPYN